MKKVWAIILAGCVLVLGALFFPRLSHAPASLIELFLKRTPVRIGFAGDMMFDRYIRYAGSAHGYDFILASTTELLAHHDAVVANLEGPVTPYASVSAGSEPMSQNNYTFTFSGDVPAALAAIGGECVGVDASASLVKAAAKLAGARERYNTIVSSDDLVPGIFEGDLGDVLNIELIFGE
jgi:hypothetical protein